MQRIIKKKGIKKEQNEKERNNEGARKKQKHKEGGSTAERKAKGREKKGNVYLVELLPQPITEKSLESPLCR